MTRASFNLKARLIVGLYDLLGCSIIAGILSLGFAVPALAYVDPSVMTYTIQALAGVAVALSAVAGVAFRRTRKALFKLLNIDEDARKDHDPAWVRTTPLEFQVKLSGPRAEAIHNAQQAMMAQPADQLAASASSQADTSAALTTPTDTDKSPAAPSAKRGVLMPLPWYKRLLMALLAVGFPAFTIGIAAPFEIVAGNADALSYSLSDIAGIFFLVVGIATVLVALALSLLKGKAFAIGCVICVAGGLCFYVQAMALNAGMPVMNGTPIDYWGDHGTMMVVSAAVWLVILAGAVVAVLLKPRIARTAALTLAGILIVVQGVGVASLFGQQDDNVFVTEDGLYETSTGGNVVVFILDHFDTKFFSAVQEQYPESLSEMTGFTWYTDSSGMMVPTLFAVPYLLTGETPQVGQDIHDYYRSRYLDSSLIDDLISTGWTLGLYTSDIQESYFTEEEVEQLFVDRTINVHGVEGLDINTTGALKILTKAALFRDMPWILKSRFWFYTDELNQRVLNLNSVKTDENGNIVLSDPEQTPYIIDDVLRKTELEAYGLTVNNSIGMVKFIHLNGAHLPFTMNIDGQRVAQDSVTQTEQAAGALTIVGEYLAKMKELGIYDDATIIITADHGDWVASGDLPTMQSCPILLVKEAGSSEGELTTSDKEVSHANVIATIVSAVGADSSAYGPTLVQAPQETERSYYHISTIEDRVKDVYEYTIDGDANDFSNWHYTGNYWVVEGGVAD